MLTKKLKIAAFGSLIVALALLGAAVLIASPASAQTSYPTTVDSNCYNPTALAGGDFEDNSDAATTAGTASNNHTADMIEKVKEGSRSRYGVALVTTQPTGGEITTKIYKRTKAPVICALGNLVENSLFASISLMVGSVLLVLVAWKMIFRGGGGRMGGGGGGGSKLLMLTLAIMFLMPTQVGLPALSAIMNFGYSIIPRVADLLPT